MNSRDLILRNISSAGASKNVPLPVMKQYPVASDNVKHFSSIVESIGGKVIAVDGWVELDYNIQNHFGNLKRVISTIAELPSFVSNLPGDPHDLESVELAIMRGHFGVAENGAIWVTDDQMGDRSLPFISQHLVLVINRNDIVPTLQEAYEKIELMSYDFGTFIAGPSKTADIEQSLVLGAHGPKSLVVFLM